jgi:hypothetical protein
VIVLRPFFVVSYTVSNCRRRSENRVSDRLRSFTIRWNTAVIRSLPNESNTIKNGRLRPRLIDLGFLWTEGQNFGPRDFRPSLSPGPEFRWLFRPGWKLRNQFLIFKLKRRHFYKLFFLYLIIDLHMIVFKVLGLYQKYKVCLTGWTFRHFFASISFCSVCVIMQEVFSRELIRCLHSWGRRCMKQGFLVLRHTSWYYFWDNRLSFMCFCSY